MGGSSVDAPDTVGAAKEAGEQARWLNREQTIANRPNQINPWGSTQWVRAGYQPGDPQPLDFGALQNQMWGGGGYTAPAPYDPLGPGGQQPYRPGGGSSGGGGNVSILPVDETITQPGADIQPGGMPPGRVIHAGGLTQEQYDNMSDAERMQYVLNPDNLQASIDAYKQREQAGGDAAPNYTTSKVSNPNQQAAQKPGWADRPYLIDEDKLPPGTEIPTQEQIDASIDRYNQGAWPGGMPPFENWTQIETLNPQLQASLDAQFETQKNRAQAAAALSQQLREQDPTFDFDQFGDVIGFDPAQQRQAAEDAMYGRAASRLDPQFEQQRNDLELRLRNRGLREGDQQYDTAMQNFARSQADAYEQARMGAVDAGQREVGVQQQMNQYANQLRTQQMQEALFERGYTLDQINALMQGQEIEGSTPSMDSKATIADVVLSGE